MQTEAVASQEPTSAREKQGREFDRDGAREHAEERINHDPRAFIPFSFGPSNCVGKALALQNMRTILCYLVQKLDIELPEGTSGEDLARLFTYRTGTLPVVVRCRD